jgi:glucans biosynthesis protein
MLFAARFAPLLILFLSLATGPAWAQGPFDFAAVEARAQKLASQPYKDVQPIGGEMKKLGYDQYRALRSKPETALWRDSGLFRVEFFPAGFIYDRPVNIGVVENGNVTPVVIGSGQFDFADTGLKEPPKDLALAGFKITFPLNGPDKFDEVIAFLGASYFRQVGRGQNYGSSARGLAIDTATDRPEEFPTFRSFWLVKPAANATELTVWALLDSPGASGAFSFVIRPGSRTVVETKAVLFLRHDVSLLALAPLTSMYFAGKGSPPRDDYRPEIHDADGLFMLTGHGERIWRPLGNPSALAVSSYSDNNPRGFGLMQRERSFERQQRAGGDPAQPVGRADRRLGRRRGAPGRDPFQGGDQRQRRRFLGPALVQQARQPDGVRLSPVRADRRRGTVAAGARGGDPWRCGSEQ